MDNPNPNPTGTEKAPEGTPQPGSYQDIMTKKGFKDNEAFAKSYGEAEQSNSKAQNALNIAKQHLETQSQGMYTMDDKGAWILTEQGKQQQNLYGQPGQQQPGQQQPGNYQDPNAMPVYDPYTNQPITDQLTLNYYRQPPLQREIWLNNALADTREKQQTASFQHETEIMNQPESKGFEQEIKQVMMQVPLAQRSTKQAWEDARLKVKGARYDQDKQTWNQQGGQDLLNKMGAQTPAPAGGGAGGGGAQLPQNLEDQYQWYVKNRPGLFKDKADFIKYTTPTGGK